MLKSAITSCCLMSLGDFTCQKIIEEKYNFKRTLMFGTVGLTLHGPYYHYGFKWIDSKFGPNTQILNCVKKSIFQQVTIFPVYVGLFYNYISILKKENFQYDSFYKTLKDGAIFWPIFNTFQFKYIAPNYRVPAVASAGLVWNTYLSYLSNIKE